jgi:tetratricopeptide (TPR) repeat protein
MVNVLEKKRLVKTSKTPVKSHILNDTDLKKKLTSLTFVLPALVLGLIFLVYLPALPNGFVWDDHLRIENNGSLDAAVNIIKMFDPQQYVRIAAEPTFRPVVLILRFINHALWGGWAPGHHLINILLHMLVALLLYFVALRYLKNIWAACFTALFFGIHPLTTETVGIISFHADILAGIFFLTALLSYWNYRFTKKTYWFWITLGCYLLAALSKENAIILPAVILVAECFWQKEHPWPYRKHLMAFTGFLLVCAVFYLLRFKLYIPSMEYYSQVKQLPLPGALSTTGRLFLLYLSKIFWPLRLTAWEPFERSTALTMQGFCGILVLLLFVALLFRLLQRRNPTFFGGAWFLLLLLPMLQFIPTVSSVFAERWAYFPLMGVSLTLGALLLLLFNKDHLPHKKAIPLIVVTILILFGLRTSWRGPDLNNDLSLWQSALAADPDNHYVMGALGDIYMGRQQYDKALKVLHRANKIAPDDIYVLSVMAAVYSKTADYNQAVRFGGQAYSSNQVRKRRHLVNQLEPDVESGLCKVLCFSFLRLEQVDRAIYYGERGISVGRTNNELLYGLGQAYEKKKLYPKALSCYQKMLDYSDQQPADVYLAISRVNRAMERPADALPFLEQAYHLFPENLNIRLELASLYRTLGRNESALQLAGEAVTIDVDQLIAWSRNQPRSPAIVPRPQSIDLMNQIKILESQGNWTAAIPLLEQAQKLDPRWDQPYLDLGMACIQQNNYGKGLRYWLTGLKLNPHNPYYFVNLGHYFELRDDLQSTRKLWERALEIAPGLDELRASLQRLNNAN